MKNLILLFFLNLICTNSFSQIIDFNDPAFKQKLIVLGVDVDGDSEISTEEAKEVSSLNLADNLYHITDLSGIEYFVNLDSLSCEFQGVHGVNLNNNSKISYLNFLGSNNLDSLSIDSLTNLEYLNLIQIGNEFDSIDVSVFPFLKELYIEHIAKLDVSQNPEMEVLSANNIPDLDVTNNLKLKWLSDDRLTSIDLSHNIDLEYFSCIGRTGYEYASLKELDVTKNTKLKELRCPQNLLIQIDLSKNIDLDLLWISTNPLEKLDVSNNSKLRLLSCTQIGLDSLDLSSNQYLRELSCFSNNIRYLDLSNNSVLESLNCGGNEMEFLDVSNCVLLEHIDCRENEIKSLDFGSLNKLSWIQITENPNLQTVCVWELPFPPEGVWLNDWGCPLLEYKDCTIGTTTIGYEGIEIYPNPAHDYIVIKSVDYTAIGLIEIYDIAGKVVLTYQAPQIAGEYRIGIEDLENGIYFLRLGMKDRHHVKSFVKQ